MKYTYYENNVRCCATEAHASDINELVILADQRVANAYRTDSGDNSDLEEYSAKPITSEGNSSFCETGRS
jgi:hypothetical protein